jgi:hypothetical protein
MNGTGTVSVVSAVRCPHCEDTQGDLWAPSWGCRGEALREITVSCGRCGVDYLLIRHLSVRYESRMLSEAGKTS